MIYSTKTARTGEFRPSSALNMAIEEGLARHFREHRAEILSRLRFLAGRLHELREPRYQIDLVFSGALRRAFSLTRGFFDLVAAENYISAAPLVRLQLDNAIRTVAVIHVDDPDNFIRHVAKGKRIDQLRDKEGHRLTDKHIVDHLVANENLPWVRRVYEEGSRFVHLSDVHVIGLGDGEGQLFDREPMFTDLAFLALVETFVMATELFDVFLDWWLGHKASPSGEVPPKRIPPRDDSLTERFKALLRDHGLITCSYNDVVLVDGEILPAIRASAHRSEDLQGHSVQLDIEVLFEDYILCESFMGLGETESAAIGDALHNFEIGVLPVMRTTLWERMPDYQVAIEQWAANGSFWKVTIGPDIRRGTNPGSMKIPDEIDSTIKQHIALMTFGGDLHWLRLFYAQVQGEEPVIEVLFDNTPWNGLRDAIRHLLWKPSGNYCSFRRFYILQPQAPEQSS